MDLWLILSGMPPTQDMYASNSGHLLNQHTGVRTISITSIDGSETLTKARESENLEISR